MRRKKQKPPLPPHEGRGDPPEHVAAREALVERIATQGLTANFSFKQIVRQLMVPPSRSPDGKEIGGASATREEAEEAVRRAEESIRSEMSTNGQRDMALSYRRLMTASRKVFLQLEGATDPSIVARLAHTLKELEERLSRMRGWDEPERMHVVVTNPSDRVRKAFEGFDDEALIALAIEQEESYRTIDAARKVLGLPPEPMVVREEDDNA